MTAPLQRAPDEVRFWSKVDRSGPHWLWTAGKTPAGYGYVWWQGKMRPAHRVAWELSVGPIPDGLTIDHLRERCGERACVKALADESGPAHLEPVTHKVNVRRGDAPQGINFRKTHCINGHEFTPENTIVRSHGGPVGRECRICTREGNARRLRAWRARRKAKQSGVE